MNQISPPVCKQTLPSPPTSTPTHAPPASLSKRKSVNFNDKLLRSARSVPNHRSRARTIAVVPRTTVHHHGLVQPTLLSLRSHADQQKRARLSLAAPQLALSTSPSASRNRESNMGHLPSNCSPLSAKSAAKKKLARFYYNPSSHQQVPRRALSPTLSTSAGFKQTGRSYSAQVLSHNEVEFSPYSDDSSDSDEEIASALLHDLPDSKRNSSRSRNEKLEIELTDDPPEELAELRPILKQTPAEILLAETVQQATAENGRARISLDPSPMSNYRRIVAAVVSQTAQKSHSNSSSDAPSRTSSADATGHSESSHPGPSSRSGRQSENYSSSNGLTSDTDLPDDDSHSSGTNPVSASGHPVPADSSAIEAFLLSSLRSRLLTLRASLLPPPDQMRLDPISPLAKLTSPQKLKLSKLGTLDGSPREPRGVLPRAPTSNARLELRQSQPRTRGRSWLRSSATLAESRSTTPPPVTSGPLRTPESSPVRQAQPSSQVAITLREVEDAYISLHDHLDTLMILWQETGQLCDQVQQQRLGPLFADDVGAAFMKCLVREVENLCRHDETTPVQSDTTPATNPTASSIRDDIYRMMIRKPTANVITSSSNNAPAPSPTAVKPGASTNEIRRRVAEIETGQAALRCIAILWSWPSCMVYFDDSYTKRLLSLLIQIPKSSILRRKKNLLAIGLLNHIFKLQRLECATLEPHVSDVVDAIASTLYLSAGKSGDKGQKVLCLGLSALQQLTTQVPQHIAPKIGKFLEPLLASLTAPDSAALRHQARAGLGALINCTKQEWHVSPPTNGRDQLRLDVLHKLQQDKKEAFKEKLSTFALAYFNDKNTFLRWALLEKQLRRSLHECDFGWVISVMATMIVLLGKRIRKLNPPLTRVFMPIINQLLRDTRTNHLVSQLWDYYIYVMFRWSAEHRTRNLDQVWALDPAQLPFLLQLFRTTYLASAVDAPSMDPDPSNDSTHTHITNKSEPYQSLLQPNKNLAGAAPEPLLLAADSRHPRAGSSANPHSQPLDTSRPSHHVLMAAYLYGSIGYIKDAQPHPPVCSGLPSELLAATVGCSRFRYLDIVWDEIVEPFLPSILAGPNDEHRSYAYDVLAALFRYGSADTPDENRWDLERLIHPVYHQPPNKPELPTQICLEEFTNVALSSAIVPVEIPALDPLWICSRYDRVLWIVACSISSIQYIKNPKTGTWVVTFPAYSQREGEQKPVGPRNMFRIWQDMVKSIASVYETCDWIFDTELSNSVCAISATLEQSIQIPSPLGLPEDEQLHPLPNIFLFRNLYNILKHGMGLMLMSRKLVTANHSENAKAPRKISLCLKTLAFVFASPVAGEIADALGTQDWIEYDVLTQMVMDDFIAAQKVMGSNEEVYELIGDLSEVLEACTKERLQLLLGKCAMKVVTELMKIVEPGVLPDEPSLQPAAALMINASFKTIQAVETIDPALRKEFIEVFNCFLSRLTQGSLKILLDGCRTTLAEYLKDERNSDRELVYCTLLTKLGKVNLGLLVSSLELSTLITPPCQNQSRLSTVSVNEFIAFVKTSAPVSEHLKDIVPAEKTSVSVLSSFPLACLPSSATGPSSSPMLSMPPPDKAPLSSPSILEKSATLIRADNLHDTTSHSSSITPDPRSLINESQAHSPVQENPQGKSSRDSARPTGVSPGSSLSNSNAHMAKAGARHDQSCCVSLDRVDPLLRSRIDSPPEESHDRTAESLNVLDDGLVKKSSLGEKKAIDTTHLENKPVQTGHQAAPESSHHGTQIQHRKSHILAPLQILPRTACSTQHLDPRFSSVNLEAASPCPSARSATQGSQIGSDLTSRPSASGSLPLTRPDVRDPALSRPPHRQATFENGHDMGCRRNVQLDISDRMRDPGSLSVTLHTQDSPLIKYWVDPQLADPNTPILRFDEITELPFYQQIEALMSLSDRTAALPPNPRLTLLNPGHPKANQSLKTRAIPSPGLSSAAQQRTPSSFLVPGEAHESGVLPLTTSLGALDTLAPFAKRLPAKCLSDGSAPLEPAQSARQMLQNMSMRKPPAITKTTTLADTGSPAEPPSSQNHQNPSGTLQTSSKPDLLAKRKRDEPHCNLTAKPSHPSPATSSFAASSLVSRQDPPPEPCAGTKNSTAPSDPPPHCSPSKESPVASSPGRMSRPSPLSPSLPGAVLDGDAEPPRKKAKCDQSSSGEVPEDTADDATHGSGLASPAPPESAQCADACASASPSDARRRTGKKRAHHSELQQLLRDAKQPNVVLHNVSSSQLGRIAKSASDILVARASRVTRSASRSSASSNDRLPN